MNGRRDFSNPTSVFQLCSFVAYGLVNGTLLVVAHGHPVCDRSDRDGAAGVSGNDYHFGWSPPSPSDAWPGKKYWLENHCNSPAVDPRDLCARFSERLLRSEIFRGDKMGNVRRDVGRAPWPLFWHRRAVYRSSDRRGSW